MSIKTLKTISLSIVLSLLLVLLAGCGGPADTETDKPEESSPAQSTPTPSAPSEEESGEDEVTYDFGGRTIRYVNWGHPGPTEVTPKREDRIPELEKKFNCKFEFFTIPMDNYLETFTSSTLAGDPMAEIVQMHIMWFYPGLASKGFLTPLDDLGVFDFDDPKWDPLMKKYGSFKGKIYSMATGKTPPQGGIFWNKTLFERDNLPDLYELQNNYEWTWDKFREIAILATRDTDGDGSIDQWGIDGLGSPYAFMASNNGSIVGLDGDKPVLELIQPNTVEALQYYQDLKINEMIFFTAPEDAFWDYCIGQFAAGKTAMLIGPFWLSYMINESIQDEYGFVYFPMGPKAEGYKTQLSGFNFPVMSSEVKNPEEVALFWDAFTDPFPDDDPDEWFVHYENVAMDRGTLETIKKMMENEEDYYIINMAESFPELYTLCGTMFGQISLGNMTAQAAVDMVTKRMQAILDEFIAEYEQLE